MRRETSEELARTAQRRLEALARHWSPSEDAHDPADAPADARAGAPAGDEPRPGRHAADTLLHGPTDRIAALVPPYRGRLLLALLVAVTAALVAGWMAFRSAPRPVPVAAVTRSAPASAAAGPTPSSFTSTGTSTATPARARSSPGVVVVDVAGKVRHPGIATLPAGSRVIDAIRRAGGVRAGVDTSGLNLARVVVDGEQILVGVSATGPAAGPAAAAGSAPASGALVNLNTASATDLEGLPGVGPVTAQKVIAWRAAHGSFTAIDELLEVPGIGPKTLAEIAPGVTL